MEAPHLRVGELIRTVGDSDRISVFSILGSGTLWKGGQGQVFLGQRHLINTVATRPLKGLELRKGDRSEVYLAGSMPMLTFYQLPEVDVHLLRGLTLEGKATQVVWMWGHGRVHEDPARRLRTPGGTDRTVARVCLVLWERQGACECSVSPPL